MSGLIGRAHLAVVADSTPLAAQKQPRLTDREAFLLGALLSHEVAAHADRYGGLDLVDPRALDDIRDQLRERWMQRLGDGGGDEGARLVALGRGTT